MHLAQRLLSIASGACCRSSFNGTTGVQHASALSMRAAPQLTMCGAHAIHPAAAQHQILHSLAANLSTEQPELTSCKCGVGPRAVLQHLSHAR